MRNIKQLEQENGVGFAQLRAKPLGSENGGGRSYWVKVLPVLDSKMIVALYRNAIGRSYLKFLLECERVATELTPKLIAQNQELHQKLKALEDSIKALEDSRAKVRALPKPKLALVQKKIWGTPDLFGGEVVSREMIRHPIALVSREDALIGKRWAMINTLEGLNRSLRRVNDELDLIQGRTKPLQLAESTEAE
jgi:hypothetical protein